MREIDVKKLSEQLDAAQAILDQIRVTSGCDTFGPPRVERKARVETVLETARRAYEERKSRSELIGSKEIFGEPAWDLLLDLFIHQSNDENVTVKAASLHPDTPASTTIRWLRVLEHNGLLETHIDPANSEQHLVHLTPTGYEGMMRYLESVAR